MNIVVATDFAFVNGGAAKIALGGAKALAMRGHDVTLFTAVGPVSADLLGIDGLHNVCLGQKDVWSDPSRVRAAVHSVWNATAATRLAEVLKPLPRDNTVVHLHSWTKALSSSVVRAARAQGFRVIVTLHDFMSVCPTGTLFHHGTGRPCGLQPLSMACVTAHCDARSYAHKLWRVMRQGVQTNFGDLPAKGGDFVIISKGCERIFRPLLPAGARLHHVQNFTEAPRVEPVPVERNDAVMYVGRLSAEKGPGLLAECVARLGLRAIFVGDGELAPSVRALCPSAEITGWLSTDEVFHRLRQARVLVLPSAWFELQGLVVAEAAALGVPAIVPATSGAAEWVVDGTTGLWFAAGDADDLSRQISRVMDDADFASRLGEAARQRFWATPPTIERHVQRLEAVYTDVLARKVAA